MELTEKKKLPPMLARLKKKGKLKGKVSKEDIMKFGTREEIEFLKEDVYGYQSEGPADAGIAEQEAYDTGYKEGYKKGINDAIGELKKIPGESQAIAALEKLKGE
jgi:hypothetical protein